MKDLQSAPFVILNETANALLGDNPTVQLQKQLLGNLKLYVDRIHQLK